ncbi:MAG TPA: histidine kinase N-terminal 7TM domain-containing protein, partial [Blastocatellia bacterium]|nr:histidine kinase N-terminal 7TM domain-containing protein [Blastocatellia bacterium]
MTFTLISLLLLTTALINLWLGIYVYRRDSSARQNRAFGFMAATISIWALAVTFAHYGSAAPTWAMRFAFASSSLIPLGLLAFIEGIPVSAFDYPRWRKWLLNPIGITLCILSFSPWVVVTATSETYGPRAVYGPLHAVFAVNIIISFVLAVCLLTFKYRSAAGLVKLHVRYLIFAFGIPSALATFTNLIIPLFLGTSTFGRYGPFFSLLLLALIGHAIIRHRLMDMRVVIKRSVVYLAAFTAAGLILITLLVTSNLI